MAVLKSYILLAMFIVLMCREATGASSGSNNNGNANNGNNNGNVNDGNNNGNANNGNNNGNVNTGDNNGNANNGNNNGNANGNGSDNNGNGNNGNGNNGNGNNGNGHDDNGDDGSHNNGNGNNGNNNGNGNGNNGNKGNDPDTTNHDELTPLASGQERSFCKAKNNCYSKTMVCPAECPQKKPKKNKKTKGCFVNCGNKCEVTCKWRKPNCDGHGSLCYDPRFVGGDGVMFYFHGAKGGNFAVVSDDSFQINAHFIGTRPEGRTRDFTWVQSLAFMFDTHTLVVAAKKVTHWDDKKDALSFKWDGETIDIPTDGDAEWRINAGGRQVIVERTDDTNNVRVTVSGLVESTIKVRPIGEKENQVHKYQIPKTDTFAHLETQFKFNNLTDLVEGILGKTYRPDYVSPVKRGVPMPIMGGEDKYQTPSLYSTLCKSCRFQRPSVLALASA